VKGSVIRRIHLFLRQHYAYGLLVGLLLTVFGIIAGYNGHPYWLALLVGIGDSVIAAALVTLLSPATDELYQQFLALGIRELWPSRRDVPGDNWCEWLGGASKTCTLLGVVHGEWRNDLRFEPALRKCLGKGVDVKILFLNPNSRLAEIRAGEEQRPTPGMIKDSIKMVWDIRGRFDVDSQQHLHLYAYDSTPSSGATWIDSFMIVTHYLAGYPNRTSPAFRVHDQGGDSLFGIYRLNIERILKKDSTIEITEENVAQYRS